MVMVIVRDDDGVLTRTIAQESLPPDVAQALLALSFRPMLVKEGQGECPGHRRQDDVVFIRDHAPCSQDDVPKECEEFPVQLRLRTKSTVPVPCGDGDIHSQTPFRRPVEEVVPTLAGGQGLMLELRSHGEPT